MSSGAVNRRVGRRGLPSRLLALAIALPGAPAAVADGEPVVLEDFSDAGAWTAQGTDDVVATLRTGDGALCLDYDLAGTAGYATLSRALPVDFPPNFALTLRARGDAASDDFQLKFADASGDNVWWWRQPAFAWPREWRDLEIPASAMRFAWGPATDRALRTTAKIELTIAAGAGGGKGSVCFDRLALRALDGVPPAPDAAVETLGDAEQRARVAAAPKGAFPRGVSGEQQYWTILGVDGGGAQALFSEDGAIETQRGGWSLEPFIVADGAVLGWPDATVTHALEGGDLPMPRVTRTHGELSLAIDAFATGTPAHSDVLATYTLTNAGDHARELTLMLAVRPWQVNPPSQFLNTPGGAARIDAIEFDDRTAIIDGRAGVFLTQAPDGLLLANGDSPYPRWLLKKPRGGGARSDSKKGQASIAFAWRVTLAAGASRAIAVQLPLAGEPTMREGNGTDWNEARAATAKAWRDTLDRVAVTLPPSQAAVSQSLRTALAHILIEREGPALRPGTRSYSRTWIRDGAMMSESLLRLGVTDVAREFTDWYATRLFSNGKVPCCVDARGSDPVAENDSAGEFIHLVAELYRYDRDRDGLRRRYPAVKRAMAYLETLRQSERTAKNRTPDRRALYGLMPPSISHEGYSAKPAYSYWDDFWALAGYRGGAEIARVLGERADATKFATQRDQFRADLVASIRASTKQHKIAFIPGAADLGDFDATSTTIALAQGGAQADLPADLLKATFARYWTESRQRANGEREWDAYTPYEWRNVGALVRLGERDQAQAMLRYFMADRKPLEWNQWAEVVSRTPRVPKFLGDIPHGWVASDFIYAVLDLFAYERHADRSLVLAAGIPDEWLRDGEVSIANLRTPYGALGYSLSLEGACRVMRIAPGETPPGGLIVRVPKGSTASLGGAPLAIARGEAKVSARPAVLRIATTAKACDGVAN